MRYDLLETVINQLKSSQRIYWHQQLHVIRQVPVADITYLQYIRKVWYIVNKLTK